MNLYNKRSFMEAQPLIAQVLQNNPQSGAAWLMRADLIIQHRYAGIRSTRISESAEYVFRIIPNRTQQRFGRPGITRNPPRFRVPRMAQRTLRIPAPPSMSLPASGQSASDCCNPA